MHTCLHICDVQLLLENLSDQKWQAHQSAVLLNVIQRSQWVAWQGIAWHPFVLPMGDIAVAARPRFESEPLSMKYVLSSFRPT